MDGLDFGVGGPAPTVQREQFWYLFSMSARNDPSSCERTKNHLAFSLDTSILFTLP